MEWKKYFLNLLRNDKTDLSKTSNNDETKYYSSNNLPVNSMMYFLQLIQKCQDNVQNTP